MTNPSAAELQPWEAALDRALADANIPTLMMVLVTLTCDTKWLSPRYRCTRVQGLDEDGTGGMSEEVRAEVLAAARAAILRWKAEGPTSHTPLPHDVLARMMEVSTGERIPPSYGAMVAAGLGYDEDYDITRQKPVDVPVDVNVVIIGAGVAGICAAIRLKRAGIPFTVLEKNATIGGTWWENRYPGCGVDTPSHIYSFSFAKHDWRTHFALQPEIQAYFERVTDDYDVRGDICFNTCVEAAHYDEGSARWSVTARDANGETLRLNAKILIGAVGVLNTPRPLDIPGLDSFPGPCFHTARWPENLDLAGKRVAVIGNGASAMQIVPEIASTVDKLIVFQRSKQWAAPFAQFRKPITEGARFLLREVPYYQEWYRQRLLWIFNDRIHTSLQIDPDWPHPERAINAQNDRHREFFTNYVKAELGARQDLLPHVLPDFPPFGKRMLMDNGWYRTVARDNVTLVPEPVARIEGRQIITTSGARHDADILVVATGFDAVNVLASFRIHGRKGLSIRDAWKSRGAEAFMGMTVPEFPNFFILSGPNTGLGHGGSVVALIESQVRYIVGIVEKALAKTGPAFEIEVKRDVHDDYNARVQHAHEHMIWSHRGMSNWYRNAAGRVVVTTPFRNDDNWHAARRADLDDFVVGAVGR